MLKRFISVHLSTKRKQHALGFVNAGDCFIADHARHDAVMVICDVTRDLHNFLRGRVQVAATMAYVLEKPMRLRIRTRLLKAIKWACLSLFAIFLIWLPISCFWGVGWDRAYPTRDWLGRRKGECFRVAVKDGSIGAGTTGLGYKTGFYWFRIYTHDLHRYWRWPFGHGGREWHLSIPIWCILVATGVPGIYLLRRDRRPPTGHCRKCGYDLTGNVSGACPECGLACDKRMPLPEMHSVAHPWGCIFLHICRVHSGIIAVLA